MLKTPPTIAGPAMACLFLFTLSLNIAKGQEAKGRLLSPDGKLEISFKTGQLDKKSSANQLFYTVSFRGKDLFKPSALSLELKGSQPLGADVHITGSKTSSVDETYQLVVGKAGKVRDQYNALQLELQENTAPGRKLVIEARAYNDAVAFRYVAPQQQALQDGYELVNENTEFHFSTDATTYAQVLPHYKSMYESEYLKLSVSAFSNQGGVKSSILIGLPMLAEVPGAGWVAIAESELQGYSSMYLTNPSGGWSGHTMLSRLAPRLDSSGIAVKGKGSLRSAWRIIMAGDEPGKLIESNAVMNLTSPSAIANTEWIKSGKASWDWWSGSLGADGKPAFTTANMKYYVDFAAKSGLEYMLVDAGWSGRDLTKMNGKVDIPELVKYAAAKNVKVWIWLYGGAVATQMNEAFALYEKWGVAGVKIDFIERDDQEGIDFYYTTARKAAEHHLMIDFHGCTKPFGLERTYPNVMNYESVLGMEQSKGGTRDNPDNHVMLAFTRMLTGPMDYTPGGFDNVTREQFFARSDSPMVMGTRAHHLALYVVYQAQFEMVSDYPAAYEGQADFEFIKKVPASWDEIKVLHGVPGEYITIARRKGNDWYIGSITNWTERTLSIPLSFLGDGNFTAEIYSDAADAKINPKHTAISRQQVNSKTVLQARLVTGGGYAVRITKTN
ncbi:glycoside hydrolase family 97 protein [Foetidibacter luteolus]|uniref:glycoside hydrolase family 97 protein n=1 Tax=Foetidibacter luteolus TaxID=2608880 RepID=UPI001A9A0DCF|nr:glycoside hydrolase family 97 protein [Foetidibacter luteolus]